MVIFTGLAMGIAWFSFEGFFWIEILKTKIHERKATTSRDAMSIFCL